MKEDPRFNDFLVFLMLFTFCMNLLITAGNLFQLFIGWEGVGLCSYLLINFWSTRLQATKSALQAVIMNKFGDIFLAIAMLIILIIYRTTDFEIIRSNLDLLLQPVELFNWGGKYTLADITAFCLLIGALAKSAQFGFHTWLLSAMEGPTPVSALLHAATMVTAGIFLIQRCYFIINLSNTTLFLLIIFGSLTSIFAATSALAQYDLKKIIALSTCSQLGYMFFSAGCNQYLNSLYHLINHAFFKALLFLCAGSIIHAMQGEQDIRRMGNLLHKMPLTSVAMLIASLSLIGFPFLSGFYSKDAILEGTWLFYEFAPNIFAWQGIWAWLHGLIIASLTAFYSFRSFYYVFLANQNSSTQIYKLSHESDTIMLNCFRALILCSIFSGYLLFPVFQTYLFGPLVIAVHNVWPLTLFIKLAPTVFALIGFFTSIILYKFFYKKFNNWLYLNFYLAKSLSIKKINHITTLPYKLQIYYFLIKRWGIDIIYNYWIVIPFLNFSKYCYEHVEQGILEILGPTGLQKIFTKIGLYLLQWKDITEYFLSFLGGFALIIFLFII
eukprot:TRINITY_DN8002_c0_g2_i1.p2 TRINITY_DN8002_c0_g2~~TRINITY_DN8002_c0_g2_i1.p2  ORF type:complete len:598 (+),score=-153.70 TRINITY_DN8002_c0_g2_i1:133-1794(+)